MLTKMRSFILGFFLVSTLPDIGVHGFLRDSVQNVIRQDGNLTCEISSPLVASTNHQLCAIRVYEFLDSSGDSRTVSIFDGFSFVNIFRQYIKRQNCSNFRSDSVIGIGRCTPLPYENVLRMTLCICASDQCNRDLNTCRNSVEANTNTIELPSLLADIPSTIPCSAASDVSYTCGQISDYARLVNSSACETYVRNHSVLCTIDDIGSGRRQQALADWNYDMFLSTRLRELKKLLQQVPSTVIYDTVSYVYVNFTGASGYEQHCVCKGSSLCNSDYAACAPQIIEQTSTTISPTNQTISTTSETTVSTTSSTVTNPTKPATAAPASINSTESSTANPTSSASTSNVTTVGSTTTTSDVTRPTKGNSSTSASTNASNSTNPTESSSAIPTSSASTSNTTTAGSTTTTSDVTRPTKENSSTAASSTGSTSFTSTDSSTTTNPPSSAQSSSNALTIGLAVGISAFVVLIVGGIVFAKFIFPKCCGNSGRSSAYLV